MCISSSLVSIEVEFFTNVVIDGILRPKEGYTTSQHVSQTKAPRIRSDRDRNVPWKENESAYRPRPRQSRPLHANVHKRRTHQFNETVLPELPIQTARSQQ